VAEHIPVSLSNVLRYGYYPALIFGLMFGVMILYRVSCRYPAVASTDLRRDPGDSGVRHRHPGLRVYLRWITSTGYTYGALSTPIAFLLFAFFRRFRDNAGRRAQCRRPGGIPGTGDARPTGCANGWCGVPAPSLSR